MDANVLFLSKPTAPIVGRITLTASKSITNRLLILQALSKRSLEIENSAAASDSQVLTQILGTYTTQKVVDVGAAGTAFRFLTAFLAIQPTGEWLLTGSARMKERPIAPLVTALRSLGADIRYTENEGFPPVVIQGKSLMGGALNIDASISSQFISALLMIAPLLPQGLQLKLIGNLVSKPYIQLTLMLMEQLDAKYTWVDNVIVVAPTSYTPTAKQTVVEADWSSVSYWYAIAALTNDTDMYIDGLQANSLQGDSILPTLFADLGVTTAFTPTGIRIQSKNTIINEFEYDFTHCPDLAQTVAVVLAAKGISSKLSGLASLRIKETDRVQALVTELCKMGYNIAINDANDILIAPNLPLKDTPIITTYDDHRMAMAFAPLAVILGKIGIENAVVVEKSYPAFWEDLQQLGFIVH